MNKPNTIKVFYHPLSVVEDVQKAAGILCLSPFYEKGVLVRFYNIFGMDSDIILKELNESPAA